MGELHQEHCNQLRAALKGRLEQSDSTVADLMRAIEALEQEPARLQQIVELQAENERLKQLIVKMRSTHKAGGERMSTRLREALRE